MSVDDTDSEGHDFADFCLTDHPDVPLWLLIYQKGQYSDEEKATLRQKGFRGILEIGTQTAFTRLMNRMASELHQQKTMRH